MSEIFERLRGRCCEAAICTDHNGEPFIACKSGKIYLLQGEFWRVELSPPYPSGVLSKLRQCEIYRNSGYVADTHLTEFLELLKPLAEKA